MTTQLEIFACKFNELRGEVKDRYGRPLNDKELAEYIRDMTGYPMSSASINYWSRAERIPRGDSSPNSPIFMRHDRAAKNKPDKSLSVRSIQNVVDSVAITAGIPRGNFSPHYFRHAFAIQALRETGNLALVQDLMGHATPQATRVYAKIYPDDLHDAYMGIFDND